MSSAIGEQFAQAVGDKDPAALKGLLRSGVDFRAMTPARFWESSDPDAIVDEIVLGKWFGSTVQITGLVGLEMSEVGERHRVAYRFEVTKPDGDFLVEQQAYFETDDEQISWLRIMCTGYLPR